MDLGSAQWRKSTRSGNTGSCVEVAKTESEIGVRDSKNPTPTLAFDTSRWSAFLRTITS